MGTGKRRGSVDVPNIVKKVLDYSLEDMLYYIMKGGLTKWTKNSKR